MWCSSARGQGYQPGCCCVTPARLRVFSDLIVVVVLPDAGSGVCLWVCSGASCYHILTVATPD